MANDTYVGRTLGKYVITERLGRGGMAEVYKGYREDLDRTVAIKLMHAFLAAEEDFLARFKREARAMAQMRHPNIVTIHDFDVYGDNTYYLVMEYIGGGTLKDLLTTLAEGGKRLPLKQAVRLAVEVVDALNYAHGQDMVHRDIKPGNIMVDHSGRAILTDFGIVKLLGGQSMAYTATGALIGTPAYMSPEQALGKPGDARSDIYSMGILLYQMLTGHVPFEADTPLAVVLKHVNDMPEPPTTLNPSIPADMQEIILKSIAKDPDDRYQTAEEVATALRAIDLDAPAPTKGTPLPAVTESPKTQVVSEAAATQVEPSPEPTIVESPPEETRVEDEPVVTQVESAPEPAVTQVEPAPAHTVLDPVEETEAPVPAATVFEPAAISVSPPTTTAGKTISTPKPDTVSRKQPPWLIMGGIVGVLIVAVAAFFIFGGTGGDEEQPEQTATSVVAVVVESTNTSAILTSTPTTPPTATSTEEPPTATATLVPTDTPIPTATPIPIPEGMLLIPEGTFTMGSATSGRADEQPEHAVSLSAYYLDQFEVSNTQYQECVADGACAQVRANSFTRGNYRDNPEFANHPAIGVNWDQAVAYCDWAGKRLPTEAEWEYAAAGPEKLTWPWGNTFDASLLAASAADTQAVDSFPDGRSPFDVLHMAGNIAEWVQDDYSTTFYAESDGAENPLAEIGGSTRVFRGGSFSNTNGEFYRTARRYSQSVTYSDVDIGLRCAQDGP